MFFFFQAEDGIRDISVTGVQTCALPISLRCAGDETSRLRQCGFATFRAVKFCFEAIEAQAVDADDRALRDESRGVDVLYQSENGGRLALSGQHKEYLDVLAAIKSVAVDDGAASLCVDIDGFSYLRALVGNDKELDGTAHHIDYLIDKERRDK